MSPSRESAGRSGVVQSVLVALMWGFAGAILAGGGWAVGLLLGSPVVVEDVPIGWARRRYLVPAPLLMAAITGVWTFAVTGIGCLRFPQRSLLSSDHRFDVVYWCLVLPVVVAVGGGLSVVAVVESEGWLPPAVASALGFSVAGLLAGLGGYVWSRWRAVTPEPTEEDDEEEIGQPPGPGIASAPPQPDTSVHAMVLRLLPVWVVSAASLVAAAVVPPSVAALALFAMALLGFVVSGTLWSQEVRLRALERRLPGDESGSARHQGFVPLRVTAPLATFGRRSAATPISQPPTPSPVAPEGRPSVARGAASGVSKPLDPSGVSKPPVWSDLAAAGEAGSL